MLKVIAIILRTLAILCLWGAVAEAKKRERQDIADLACGLFFASLAALIIKGAGL